MVAPLLTASLVLDNIRTQKSDKCVYLEVCRFKVGELKCKLGIPKTMVYEILLENLDLVCLQQSSSKKWCWKNKIVFFGNSSLQN